MRYIAVLREALLGVAADPLRTRSLANPALGDGSRSDELDVVLAGTALM